MDEPVAQPGSSFAQPELTGVQEVLQQTGQTLGLSRWHVVDQSMINAFGLLTGDPQWIHTDPERAAHGPFGACVAHGLLTLSLAGGLLFHEAINIKARMGVNYGNDKVRYPAPLPVGSRIQGVATLVFAQAIEGNGVQMVVRMTVQAQAISKPVCVADFVLRLYF